MPREDHRFVVMMKDRWTGESSTLHLPQAERPGKFRVKYKGRNSKRYPEMTGTQVGQKVNHFLMAQQNKAFYRYDVK